MRHIWEVQHLAPVLTSWFSDGMEVSLGVAGDRKTAEPDEIVTRRPGIDHYGEAAL